MMMFDEQYRFYGNHAYRVGLLTNVFDSASNVRLFKRNMDVLVQAPLIGFLYHRTAGIDKTKNPETNQEYSESIFLKQLNDVRDELRFNFQLIMLLDKEYEPSPDKRIDKAFRTITRVPEDENRYEDYILGGVDVLYEKLIEGVTEPQDYLNRLYEFIDDFQERFNSTITKEDILKLCTK